MKAFVHELGMFNLKNMEEPTAKQGQVVVSIRVAGLNRRDLYIPDRRGNE